MPDCKCGYINEIDLIKQFEELMDKVNLDDIGIKKKIKAEVERFKKFQMVTSLKSEKVIVKDIDIRNYAKYILREGSDLEKRELLGCLRNKITLNQKVLSISKS